MLRNVGAIACFWGAFRILTKLATPTLQVQVRVEAGSGLQNLAFSYLLVLKAE